MVNSLERQVSINNSYNVFFKEALKRNPHLDTEEKNLLNKNKDIESYIGIFSGELNNYYDIMEELSEALEHEKEEYEKKCSDSYNYLSELSGIIDDNVDILGRRLYFSFLKDFIEKWEPPEIPVEW